MLEACLQFIQGLFCLREITSCLAALPFPFFGQDKPLTYDMHHCDVLLLRGAFLLATCLSEWHGELDDYQ